MSSHERDMTRRRVAASRVEDLEREVEHLHAALASRSTIDQAKGMLMLHFGVDAATAFAVLGRWASTTETKMSVIAQRLNDGAAVGRDVAAALMDDLRHGAGRPSAPLGDRTIVRDSRTGIPRARDLS